MVAVGGRSFVGRLSCVQKVLLQIGLKMQAPSLVNVQITNLALNTPCPNR